MNSLPLYEIISEPLIATAFAQTELNEATTNFINSLTDDVRPTSITETEKATMMTELTQKQLSADDRNTMNDWKTTDLSSNVSDVLERANLAPGRVSKTFSNLTFQYGNDGNGNPMTLTVPMISLVNIPSIRIKTAEINFSMEVLSQTSVSSDGKATGNATSKGKLRGRLSSANKTLRNTSVSQDYQVKITASDDGPPEGLARILDILNDRVA